MNVRPALAKIRRILHAHAWLRLEVPDQATKLVLRGRRVDSDRPDGLLRVRLRSLGHPLFVRPGTAAGSDPTTVWEIFCKHAYAAPVDFAAVRSVVDLGANIGLFLPYLLSRGANVKRYLAVDADDASLAVLRVNLRHAAAGRDVQLRVVSAAVGDRDGVARFDTSGQSIFHSLREDGDREVPLRRVTTLLDEAGFAEVDLLKIDVEGGEAAVLPTAGEWAPRVRRIVGELHDPLDRRWLARTLAPHGYVLTNWTGRFGDNFLAVRADVA